MTEQDIKKILKAVLDETKQVHIDADTHYQDHLFIGYWRSVWDRATKQVGVVIVAGLIGAVVVIIGMLVWVIDPKLIGLFK